MNIFNKMSFQFLRRHLDRIECRPFGTRASLAMLDTPREEDFDEIAEIASRICETPVVVVNLIAEGRQFFKAEVGLDVRETPLDSSFCARAILEQDFMLIPDAIKDLGATAIRG